MVQITIEDTPYGQWAAGQLGVVGAVNPFDDFDGDGYLNVGELVHGSDGASNGSVPDAAFLPEGADFKLAVPLSGLPDGVFVDAETSTDLSIWGSMGITTMPDGFVIPGGDATRFIRLIYRVEESAP